MASSQSHGDSRPDTAISSTQLERVLQIIEEGTATAVGERFFRLLTRQMSAALQCRWAFVGELVESGRSRIVDLWTGSSFENIQGEVPLTGPFETLLSGGTAFVSSNFHSSFPEAPSLVQIGATSCAAVALFAADGQPLGYLGVLHDDELGDAPTTLAVLRIFAVRAAAEMERAVLERELRSSEARYRHLVEASPDIVYRIRIGPAGHAIEYINPAVERVLGYTPAEFYAKPELIFEIASAGEVAELQQVAVGQQFYQANLRRWLHRDGSEVWTEQHNIPIYDDAGNAVALEGIARDVTARILAERALEEARTLQGSILGAIPDVLFRSASNGDLTHLLSSDGKDHGADEHPLETIMPASAARECQRAIRRARVSKSRHAFRYEIPGDSEPIVFEVRLVPADDGVVVGIVRDITGEEFMKTEANYRESRGDLEGKVERQMFQRNPYGLSFREFTVLHLVAGGSSDKEIASQLGISLFTVNKHVASIRGKFGVTSRTEASVRAIQEGLISL